MHRRLLAYVVPLAAAFAATVSYASDSSGSTYPRRIGGESNQVVFTDPRGKDMAGIETGNKLPSLSDIMTISRDVDIFYGYLRDSSALAERLANPLSTTTIFAPNDNAIMSLHRKPHQGPASMPSNGIAAAEEQEKEMLKYLEAWLKRHVIAGTDVEVKAGKSYETLAGEGAQIVFDEAPGSRSEEDWQRCVVKPGNGARVLARKEARDGILYILDGALQEEEDP